LILGFTGTRKGMTKAQLVSLRAIIEADLALSITPPSKTEWHHGCSGKSDVAASYIAAAFGMKVIGHPSVTVEPQGYYDVLLPEKLPLERDEDIAKCVELLFATPETDNETPRGGTYATVRRARKHNTRHIIIYRDGTFEEFPK
jgi:hypothetical protein